MSAAMNDFVKAGNDWKKFTYDWSKDQASILARLKTEKDPLVRQSLLLDYVDTKSKYAKTADPAIGLLVFKDVPPDSNLDDAHLAAHEGSRRSFRGREGIQGVPGKIS